MSSIEVEGKQIAISNPEKMLWPDIGVRKIDYLKILANIAPYLIAHTTDKALTSIRYPNGMGQDFFYQKRPPANTPEWVSIIIIGEDTFINLNNLSTLIWLGNLAVVEFHIPFSKYTDDLLTALVFDLDPSKGQTFEDVAFCALKICETLSSLGVECLAKTSGASGLQIFIPANKMTFEQGRQINTFFGKYFAEKYPNLITVERQVKNRGKKLYFDYLQMWRGKNIVSVYSPRAVACGAMSMPITWDELKKGIAPCDLNLLNAAKRLDEKGDLFKKVLRENTNTPVLDEIIKNSGQ
ncbi:MAG: DNA polymerase domain-containing protein [Christensenellales bacterium]|jgi:bifunctional non-homologous end joining protein LigD